MRLARRFSQNKRGPRAACEQRGNLADDGIILMDRLHWCEFT